MVLFLFLLPTLLAVIAYEAPRLVKEKMWKELAAFLALWALGSFMAIAALLGLKLPNPTDLLNSVFGPR